MTAVVSASIRAVDETVNYKALAECVFILKGAYLSIIEYSIILFEQMSILGFLFDLTGLWNTIYRGKVGTDISFYL